MNGLALPAAGGDCACPKERTLFGLSLCAGAGGLDLGLHIAAPGYRTVGYVERDAYAAAALVARMEDEALDRAPVWDDVATFNGKAWRGVVDIIHGGYPCQPFSVAGRQLGDKDPRHLWPHIARVVREIRPEICFFENVAGHLRLGFVQVHDDLRRMGYSVKAGLFTAAEVGAPHRRERLFILAYRNGDGRQQGRAEQQTRQRQSASARRSDADAVVHAERAERREKESCRHVADRQEASSRLRKSGPSNLAEANGQSEYQPSNQTDALAIERPALPQSGNGCCDAYLADPASMLRQAFEWSEPDGNGSLVGNASIIGLQGQRKSVGSLHSEESIKRQTNQSVDDGASYQLPVWPPQPGRHEQWDVVPPDLKPAICRMADGLAYRVDRLRLCGNGVIPLVAAYAFCTLATQAIKEHGSA